MNNARLACISAIDFSPNPVSTVGFLIVGHLWVWVSFNAPEPKLEAEAVVGVDLEVEALVDSPDNVTSRVYDPKKRFMQTGRPIVCSVLCVL